MKENIKGWVIGGYFVIGFFFTVYQNFWVNTATSHSAYHIGRGIVSACAGHVPICRQVYWWRFNTGHYWRTGIAFQII